MKVVISQEDALIAASKFAVDGFLKYLSQATARQNFSSPDSLPVACLATLVRSLALRSMMEPGDVRKCKSVEELHKLTQDSFATMKFSIQEAVALGFTDAMSSYAGKHLEYFCQVKTVPEPTGKVAH